MHVPIVDTPDHTATVYISMRPDHISNSGKTIWYVEGAGTGIEDSPEQAISSALRVAGSKLLVEYTQKFKSKISA